MRLSTLEAPIQVISSGRWTARDGESEGRYKIGFDGGNYFAGIEALHQGELNAAESVWGKPHAQKENAESEGIKRMYCWLVKTDFEEKHSDSQTSSDSTKF